MIIALEGIDGSGKSEQVSLLAAALAARGYQTAVIGCEERRPIRQLYRELLSTAAQFPDPLTSLGLGMADCAQTIDQVIAPLIANGAIPICHRYIYSVAADAIALGLPHAIVTRLVELIPPPDLLILLSTDPATALERKRTISIPEAGGPAFVAQHSALAEAFLAFQTNVHRAYLDHITTWYTNTAGFLRAEGHNSPEAIHHQIKEFVFLKLSNGAASARLLTPVAGDRWVNQGMGE